MKRIFWVYFALLVFGLVVLAWPEQDDLMMLQLSETHGPSKMDFAGIVIIMMGYLPMVKEVRKQSSEVKAYIGTRSWHILLGITLMSMSGIVWSLYSGNDLTLWICVAVATTAQAILVRVAYKRV